ncbi:transcriptional regulator [Solihabitans fulvus]|uniref:Transcriptional regulator n=1 Tax=Solihabitans fulvus TaxID=1892852 RepID=A0A5B2XB00_9PSEU|nr:PE domain-containing protein [Solihabitans fulvus]KAA2260129.1 transcriptional regulator [Solihabitans fulvus]
MFIADGGGSSSSPLPDYVGKQQKLSIDPSAIPAARASFETALDKVKLQIRTIQDLDVSPWAGDPVSTETADHFNNRARSDANSALDVLKGYQQQLQGTVDALKATEASYRQVEGDNAALWGKHSRA